MTHTTEVTTRIADQVEIGSAITAHSAKRLKLKRRWRAQAFIKADYVIILKPTNRSKVAT